MTNPLGEATREFGRLNGVLYLFGRVFQKLCRREVLFKYYLYAQPVAATPLLPAGRGRSIEVRPVHEHDAALREFPRPSQVIEARYAQGAVCFGAFKDDEPIGFIWLKLGDYQEDEVRCRFVPLPERKSAWDFDVYLHPKHRLSLAFPRLWDTANAFMRERGFEWTMSRISAFNAASLASHSRLGATRTGSTLFLTFTSVQLLVTSVFPFVRLTLGASRFPVVRLDPPAPGPCSEA